MKKLMMAIVGSLLVGACTPPKILTGHSFLDADKSIRVVIQESGASVGDDKNKTKLFNVFMRVCDVNGTNIDANCKETMVLGNVTPKSVY